MKKISKMATASVLLFTLANPLGVLAENNVENISATSNNKLTQDITIQAKEVNGGIVFELTAVKDTYNTVIHATINGQKFTYNLGNLKKGQVSKVVQPDVSVNRKDANDVNTNKKDAAISKENKSEKLLPNTSVVRELIEKTVSYNTELNGNVIEANVVYKTYELVEKKDEKPSEKETKPVDSKVETPTESTEAKAEEPAAGTMPKAEEPAATTPKAEEPATGTTPKEEPAATTPKAEEPAAGTMPKAEEPAAGTTPKAEEPTSEEAKAKKELADAQKDGEDIINEQVSSKLGEIEKVKDEAEKEKLKVELKTLKEDALAAIKNAKNHDAAVAVTDEYQTKIDRINVPGEALPAPNYDKDNLTNGRNEGTTIEGGSTAIGHGSGEASSGATQPESSATASTGAVSQPKATPASTGAGTQPEAATESPAPTQPATEATSDSAPTAKPQPVATPETATSGTSSFRNAPEVQIRARRVARAANQPNGTVNISYNYDGMPDINGFLSDPGENNTVAIPNSATEDEVKELVKAKIQAKAQELAKHGYKVKEEIVFEQDTIVKNFNYVVTFTKEKTGTTGFRIAPEVQVRAKKVVKRDLSNKTKQINIYYNLTNLKDIAGALGEVGENNMLTLSGNAAKEEIKKAIEEKTKSQIEKLNKQGFKVTSTTDLDQIVEGGDSYDYVVEFTKESKSTSANNTGFRKAPLVQKRAKRSAEGQETVDVNIYFNLKTLPGIAGALDVDGDTTIKLPKNATEAQVKAAIQGKIAKVEKRGYKVSDFYFGAKTDRGYDFVVEFKK